MAANPGLLADGSSRSEYPVAKGEAIDYVLDVAAKLKTVDATVSVDGTITTAEPITGPARAVLTLLVEDPEPNRSTREAMAEPVGELPRFDSVGALKADLED